MKIRYHCNAYVKNLEHALFSKFGYSNATLQDTW